MVIYEYYFPFSDQRRQLRREWNDTNTDWKTYLADAELRAQKVKDAIGESIFKMSRAEVENKYNDLYKTK